MAETDKLNIDSIIARLLEGERFLMAASKISLWADFCFASLLCAGSFSPRYSSVISRYLRVWFIPR